MADLTVNVFSSTELQTLEFHPVKVRGHFDHSKELYLKPRTLVKPSKGSRESGGMGPQENGAHVITPFLCTDQGYVIFPLNLLTVLNTMETLVITGTDTAGIIDACGSENESPYHLHNIKQTDWYRGRGDPACKGLQENGIIGTVPRQEHW